MRLSRQWRRLGRDEAGFSLIELLTTMSILLIVIGTLTTLMVSATTSEADLTLRVQAQQEARLALERMRRDVHCAHVTNLAADTSSSSVTLTLPLGCPSAAGLSPLPAPNAAFGNVTWCTSGSGSRFALRRIPGTPGSCTGGRKEADYLKQSNLFTLRTGANKLAKLCSVFPVDLNTSDTGRAYRLKDALVLRNSTRGTSGTQAAC